MENTHDTQRRLDEALRKIAQLRDMRDSLAKKGMHGVSEERLQGVVDLLTDIEIRSTGLISRARSDSEKIRHARPEGEGGSEFSGFGKLIGTLGKCAVNGVSTIVNGSVPMTKSVLKTTGNLVNDTLDSAKKVSSAITSAGAKTADSVVSGAVGTAKTLVTQTSNLAGSLTGTVSKVADGIFKKGTQSASRLVNSVLNPGGESLIGKLADSTASMANTLVGQANTLASSVLSSTGGLASNLTSKATSTVGNMMTSVSNFASGMIGGAASSLVNSVFPGMGGSGGNSSIGGLFGSALSAASSAIDAGVSTCGAAVDAASGIVKSLAGEGGSIGGAIGGLAGLASGLLGGAADVAGDMASAGMDAASSLLGAASDIGSSMLGAASEVAGGLLDTASGVAGGLLDGIGDIASSALDIAGDLVGDALDAAGDVAGAAADIAGDVLSSVGDVAGDMLDAAADMAESVIDGVTDLTEDVIDTAVDCVEDVVDAIADAFDDEEEDAEEMEEEFDDENWDDDWVDDEEPDEEPEPDQESEYGEPVDPPEDEDWGQDDNESWIEDEEYGDESSETPEDKENPDGEEPEPEDQSTVPMGDSEQKDNELSTTENKEKSFDWKSFPFKHAEGILAMMQDGDQQLLNPYGPNTSDWTMYSFRPMDVADGYPQIAITPSSFEAIRSLDTMLNNIPWIVVKEYFFKNTASTMINLVKKIMGMAKDTFDSVKSKSDLSAGENGNSGSADAKSTGSSLFDAIKEKFHDIRLKDMAIDIPYILYAGLRAKQFGNTYIFPYLANDSTLINQSSNASEWGNGDADGGNLMETLKKAMGHAVGMVAGIATSLAGSQAKAAELFPAPTWGGPGANKDKISFSFELILINDNIVKARNNYMCVNTIIHNNRYIQKAILAFPGALYEIWLPTGQRHLMCTGDFKLYPLGLNRQTPMKFFRGDTGKTSGASFPIGSTGNQEIILQNPDGEGHTDGVEVIPDAYKLQITFTSCLANNMNTAVFQYYVKMTGYDHNRMETKPEGWVSNERDPGAQVEAPIATAMGSAVQRIFDSAQEIQADAEETPEQAPGTPTTPGSSPVKSMRGIGGIQARDFTEEIREIIEKFSDSTYNKKLERYRPSSGDKSINSDSVVETIRKTHETIRESTKFLSRLYNAERNNLWYREFEKDEIYTTLKPDYRQTLKKKYRELMDQVVKVSRQMDRVKGNIGSIARQLDGELNIEKRTSLLEGKVDAERDLNILAKRKDELSDRVVQIDTDLVQAAFDEHDDVVSVKKNEIGIQTFQQVWNEKIMNSYEKDKIQYLTSEEKTRYFQEKVRELRKQDTYGILNHQDWYFRVVVLDYIVSEMQRLVYWFKNCAWDDFETIYRITRKLKLLQLDVDCIRSGDDFSVNRTNLFYLSDEDAKKFTKIDSILSGSTLYDIFQNQIRLNIPETISDNPQDASTQIDDATMKEVIRDRQTETDALARRNIRQEIVVRYFGSESELTKLAYDIANGNTEISSDVVDQSEVRKLKSEIMALKLNGNPDESELAQKLGKFTNYISTIKEWLVMQKMENMNEVASAEISKKDGTVEAEVSH